jgi:hypothetical protein
MPMAYYPAYGIPAPYPEQQVQYAQPADQSGYYAPPHDTSGQVPVYAVPAEEPVLYAEAVADEPQPAVMVRPASAPVKPRTSSAKVMPAGSGKPRAPAKGKKKPLIIALVLAAVAVIAWLAFSRGRGSADSGGKAGGALIGASGPPKVIFELPADRVFPPASQAIVMHFVGSKGPVANRKDDKGNPAEPNPNEPVFEWRDVAPLGNDNLLRSFESSADHSPRRVNWPSQPNVAGAKPNRPCLDFRLRDGTPSAMNLTDPESMIESLPFGSNTQVDKFTFSRGLTVAVVFQAIQADLPTRVLTLTSEDGASLSLRVDEQKNLVADARAPGASVDLKSQGVNGTAPCIATISWGSNPAEIQFTSRDANGKTFRSAAPAKMTAPGKSMSKLRLGQVLGSNNQPVTKADSFSGFIGEVIVFSIALKPDQMVATEGQLRDYYFQVPVKK